MAIESLRSMLMVGNFTPSWRPYRQICDELALQLARMGWAVHTTSTRTARSLRLMDMVATVWRRRHDYSVAQVDVFSGPAFYWAEAVCWTLRRARKPYVLTLHGGNLPAFARRWPGRVRRLLGSARAVTMPSRYLLDQMRPYRDDLHLLPNPIDIAAYSFRPRENPQPRLTWLRAFSGIYNPTMAVQVLARLATNHPEVRLTMIGPDKGDGSLDRTRRVADECGISELVDMPGGVPKGEVPAHLAQGDIFLNTTNVDNTPVSVLEAMACGLCVVSTNVGGIPYLLEHEVDALLVPPNDPQAMAAAVNRLFVEPGLAARISHNARTKVEGFDWSKVLPRWNCLLWSLATSTLQK
jgi:glycosyltransferase involved in cell wall biosynthesis